MKMSKIARYCVVFCKSTHYPVFSRVAQLPEMTRETGKTTHYRLFIVRGSNLLNLLEIQRNPRARRTILKKKSFLFENGAYARGFGNFLIYSRYLHHALWKVRFCVVF